ncbi:helix-turn-helix domain-containing protein [Hymenobacter aerilatus]|uniref:Helix-turn-helix domain-containing protein n=1 Tax=Hymenobacter aerilatus TaxID=2932251 RepID=A0A8T9SWK0_9BACT|nr:helix-turn-helix transcriptional regulator [Hymenobacter aerilatus]UOR06215.1 helix-turn-helix domain-containing protein [Hymenobacter aerilatus]
MRENSLKAFGLTVRFYRNELRISQEELAERCGFHRTYIGQVERGERNPSLINIITLCKSLEVTLPDFFVRYQQNSDS